VAGQAGTRITHAMVLAAGLGQRLRPVTEETPKALATVAGKPLIDHIFDRLAEVGIAQVVVNTHHLADVIAAYLATRPAPPIRISHEPELLGIGGGIARALPWLGAGPFYVANADMLWLDGPVPALRRLAQSWRDDAMDAVLLLMPSAKTVGIDTPGTFCLDAQGRISYPEEGKAAPFHYCGVSVLHPRLFVDLPDPPFPILPLWERAMARGRLWGVVHDGLAFHVGTPAGLAEAREQISPQHMRWLTI